ncbi:hypothetical protein [Streptomyces sp. HB2AG]|uniref:hypothetical protein n=1 Tax=Streptomyces sp. HB2AG TaxID=2983400 RepID=UPI0022AA10DF|nr:hypothetical protein [Streptomyces sp. HB2AG]MCZ2527410.1 hypothetical protein [Streptomyces sp. HB2AG]
MRSTGPTGDAARERLDADTAERLLRGRDVDSEDRTVRDLAGLLAEARAAARTSGGPAPGEDAAVAAFRAAARPAPRRRATRPVRAALAALAAALVLGGVAVAAGTGHLPSPGTGGTEGPTARPSAPVRGPGLPPDPGPGADAPSGPSRGGPVPPSGADGGTGTDGPGRSGGRRPSGVPSGGADGGADGGTAGLCRAYAAAAKASPGPATTAPGARPGAGADADAGADAGPGSGAGAGTGLGDGLLERLARAAGGEDRIDDYCRSLGIGEPRPRGSAGG